MSATRYDAIVVGIGGMGSATVYQLAQRGQHVLGLEKFDIPHEMGSSHGLTRIIRLAYYEHPSYVPLLKRAYELWRELQAETQTALLHITGSLDAAPEDNEVFAGSLKSCEVHNLPHEVLTSAQITQRFPAYHFPSETMAVFQPDGGFLAPELCIESFVKLARMQGAEIHTNESLLEWNVTSQGGVQVRTDRATYEADRIIFTAGAWMGKLIPELKSLAIPERQVLIWTKPQQPESFAPERFPVFNCLVEEGRYYGFPLHDHPGFKYGLYHHLDETVDPDTIDREPNERDEAALRRFGERYFPAGLGETMMMKACMFTNSPDEHFILDTHPDYPQVTMAAGFSGHGFKFCSVIGEILADLALDGTARHDISLLRFKRNYATE